MATPMVKLGSLWKLGSQTIESLSLYESRIHHIELSLWKNQIDNNRKKWSDVIGGRGVHKWWEGWQRILIGSQSGKGMINQWVRWEWSEQGDKK